MGGPTEPYKGEERDIEALKLENKSVMQIENAHSEVLNKPAVEVVDQFGSHRKTDPREIKLVRKLDLFMLPMLWVMWYILPPSPGCITVTNSLLVCYVLEMVRAFLELFSFICAAKATGKF